MKKLYSFFAAAMIITAVNAQSDSVFYYNPDGTKEWWHIQKDVYGFRCMNGLQYNGQPDTNVVEKVEHLQTSPRKLNVMHFKTNATQLQSETEKNKARINPIFECEYLVLTKQPLLDKTHDRWNLVDDYVLVTFKNPNISQAEIQQFKNKHDLIIVHQPSNQLPQNYSWTFTFRLSTNKCGTSNAVTVAKEIWEQDNAIVKIASPNLKIIKPEKPFIGIEQLPLPSTDFCPSLSENDNWLWWIDNVGYLSGGGGFAFADADPDICECYESGFRGQGSKIAVIDVHGYEFVHIDMDATFINGWNTWTNQPLTGTTYMNPNIGAHGMAVSGMIGAVPNNAKGIVGVADKAKVIPILMDGWENEVVLGLQKSLEFGADIVNMSFKTDQNYPTVSNELTGLYFNGRPDPLNSSIKYGCVLVAGAGNDNDSINPPYPANHQYVIGVGGSDPQDMRSLGGKWGWPAGTGSNFGPYYEVVAPSSYLMTLDFMGTKGYNAAFNGNYNYQQGGTSFGTPIVSGIAADILSKNSKLYASEVRKAIIDGAEKVNDSIYDYNYLPNDSGRSYEMQYGRVNCLNSLNLVVPLGVNEFTNNAAKISSFYNGSGQLILQYDIKDQSNNAIVFIYDILGKEILHTGISTIQNQKNISINTFSTGMYFLSVFSKDGKNIGSTKFVKY